jgi:hypothetical protein
MAAPGPHFNPEDKPRAISTRGKRQKGERGKRRRKLLRQLLFAISAVVPYK